METIRQVHRPTATEKKHEGGNELDDSDWGTRAEYWSTYKPSRAAGRTRFDAQKQPLILSGHGASLRVEHGALVVCDGFTHYPQTRKTWRLFAGDPRMPPRVVLLNASGYLTFDVLSWLGERQIPIIRLGWQGDVTTFCGSTVYEPALHMAQLKSLKMEQRVKIAKVVLTDKFTNCLATLNMLPESSERQWGIRGQKRALWQLDNERDIAIRRVEQIEALAAQSYFRGLRTLEIKWTGTNKKPIPDEWYKLGSRSSRYSGTNIDATHPVNAMMNYAYRILEAEAKISAVAAGLDPMIGFLHANQPERATLVYDLIEPLRPLVDACILKLLKNHNFTPKDFVLLQTGVCRLHPMLAKFIAKEILQAKFGDSAAKSVVEVLWKSIPKGQRMRNGTWIQD